jgi:hypothetical protein
MPGHERLPRADKPDAIIRILVVPEGITMIRAVELPAISPELACGLRRDG